MGVTTGVGVGVTVGIGVGVGVGIAIGVGVGFGVATGVGVGVGVGVAVGAGVGVAAIVIAAFAVSVKERLWWGLFAEALIMSVSGPDEVAVICHVTVVEAPDDRLPAVMVGVVIEKWPFCELRLAEVLDKVLYFGVLTVFFIVAVTVADWPTFNVVGV